MAIKHGLGRGLNALIKDGTAPPVSTTAAPGIQRIATDSIRPGPWQPRRQFAAEALAELQESIRAKGVLQPLLVRRSGEHYELIAGERRWRAAQAAGLREVPAILMEAADQEALELALVENLQRQDLNALEEAEAYRALADTFRLTQEQIAQRVGKARASVANALRLLNLSAPVRQLVAEGQLSAGHAKVLVGVASEAEQQALARRVLRESLSVRQLERVLERAQRPPRQRREKPADIPESHLTYLADKLHQHFGTAVRIAPTKTLADGRVTKGSIEIDFYSNEDLDRLLQLLGVADAAGGEGAWEP